MLPEIGTIRVTPRRREGAQSRIRGALGVDGTLDGGQCGDGVWRRQQPGVTTEGARRQSRALSSQRHVGKGRTREADGGERPGTQGEEQARELRETSGVTPWPGAR